MSLKTFAGWLLVALIAAALTAYVGALLVAFIDTPTGRALFSSQYEGVSRT